MCGHCWIVWLVLMITLLSYSTSIYCIVLCITVIVLYSLYCTVSKPNIEASPCCSSSFLLLFLLLFCHILYISLQFFSHNTLRPFLETTNQLLSEYIFLSCLIDLIWKGNLQCASLKWICVELLNLVRKRRIVCGMVTNTQLPAEGHWDD